MSINVVFWAVLHFTNNECFFYITETFLYHYYAMI